MIFYICYIWLPSLGSGTNSEEEIDEELLEFYLDDMLNDNTSGASVELVRPIEGDHMALFQQLQACYCTFFYVDDENKVDEEVSS